MSDEYGNNPNTWDRPDLDYPAPSKPLPVEGEPTLEEAMKLRGKDEIVGCYLAELMNHFGDIDDAWDKKDVEFQADLLGRLFDEAISDFQSQSRAELPVERPELPALDVTAEDIANSRDSRGRKMFHEGYPEFHCVNRQFLSAHSRITQLTQQLEAKDGYKLFVWQDRHRFVAMAHASSVAEAREAIWDEDGTTDPSVPVRAEMHRMVREQAPEIFRGAVAYAILTDSAELEENDAYRETLVSKVKGMQAKLAKIDTIASTHDGSPCAIAIRETLEGK